MAGDRGRPTWTVLLARRAIQDVAPDELPQFAMVAQAYLAASETQRERAMRRAEPLGLGLEGAAVVLTTAVLAVAAKASEHLVQECVRRGVDATEQGLRARWRHWRARRRGDEGGGDAQGEGAEPLPALTPEQLAHVRDLAMQAALRQRLAERTAQAVADGIIAELATAEARVTGASGAPGTSGAPAALTGRRDQLTDDGDEAAAR
ncbi:hypothetical protein AB0C11_30590 [Streptomyces sp. NPDC039016]|uniref:hypothetical protein n=1 Tax=Streptomyces sp. NPDC039016 TaxID=3154330 RepID=UPI0033CCA104